MEQVIIKWLLSMLSALSPAAGGYDPQAARRAKAAQVCISAATGDLAPREAPHIGGLHERAEWAIRRAAVASVTDGEVRVLLFDPVSGVAIIGLAPGEGGP